MEVSTHICIFGHVLIGSRQEQLRAVEFGNDIDECYRNFMNRWEKVDKEIIPRTNMVIVNKTLQSIDSGKIDNSIQIDLTGTPFQRKVWDALRLIPSGITASYSDIASKINRPDSARAIGTACGANPIAIIVPCHRVIRANGKDGGYRWGIDLKQKLLNRERSFI